MHISFIIFILIAIVVTAVSGYCLGKRVSKANQRESPEATNSIPFENCLVKNADAFKYDTFTDSRDGETYRTVKIGDQIWMVDSLRYNAKGSCNHMDYSAQHPGRIFSAVLGKRLRHV